MSSTARTGRRRKAFAADDPYARGDLFQSVEVRAWRKVLPDGR
ncbi:hypothetical protein [Bosea thiooxidans]